MTAPKITFIGTGSMVFAKNILGDAFQRPALKSAHIALMDIDKTRLEESHIVVRKLMDSVGTNGEINYRRDRKVTSQGADFVMVAFQVGDYEPCTVTDFTVCKRHGLKQTIADMLGPEDIIRTLRIIPHLQAICGDMTEVCPNATLLGYVNPMAMNIQAVYTRYPHIRQVGLCHSVRGTTEESTHDLDLDPADLHYRYTGVNHMAFYLSLEKKLTDGNCVSFYPSLLQAYTEGRAPKPNLHNDPCYESIVRYEVLKKLGYFVTESSEHFAEYTPWLIKPGRGDLITRYKVPLDEHPKRCVEQLANWYQELENYQRDERIEMKPSHEYASTTMNTIQTSESNVVYDDVRNDSLIGNLPQGCCAEVAYLVDANGIQPTKVGELPAHLAALIQTNINVQMLLTQAILTENRDYIYYTTTMDPHTAAVLGIEEIYALVSNLVASHSGQLPAWLYR